MVRLGAGRLSVHRRDHGLWCLLGLPGGHVSRRQAHLEYCKGGKDALVRYLVRIPPRRIKIPPPRYLEPT